MSVKLESSTDSAADVERALGKAKPDEVVEQQNPAPADEADETLDASGASENEELETEESKDESETETEQRPKKKGGIQKKINKLTKRASQSEQRASLAEQEREYWKAEALKNQSKPVQQETIPAPKSDAAGRPKSEDFTTHESYFEALAEWKADQKADQKWNEREAKQKEVELRTSFDKRRSSFVEKVQEFSKTHDDYDEIIQEVSDIQMSTTVRDILLDSGPELAYALAKDKEEYKRICSLNAIDAAREIGKFEAKISQPDSSKVKEAKLPNAPKPLKPLSANASGVSKAPDEMSLREYAKWRSAGGGR